MIIPPATIIFFITLSTIILVNGQSSAELPDLDPAGFQNSGWRYGSCTATNTTPSSTFSSNLDNLLSLLSSNASDSHGIYQTTVGREPDKVYGLYLCRGDLNKSRCYQCVRELSENIVASCRDYWEAMTATELCLLKYSNRDFYGVLSSSSNYSDSSRKISQLEDDMANNGVRDLLHNLTRLMLNSTRMSVTAESDTSFYGSVKRYGFAQCGIGVNLEGCTTCLNESMVRRMTSCCEGKVGWWILSPICYFRYEAHRFYNQETTSREKGGVPKSRIAIITSILGVCILLIIVLSTFRIYYKKSAGVNAHHLDNNIEFHMEESDKADLPVVPLRSIINNTNNFSHEFKLGEGGFGSVYKAIMADGRQIAIKRLSNVSSQGLEEFKNEATLIGKLQHRNLVRLLGYCAEENEKLLVYEYMPNGSLDLHLFDVKKDICLDWQLRSSIINGIAKGLMYLHEDSRLRVIHRDLKASNILLDHEMNPKISDFGMARIFGGDQRQANTQRVVGTFGYMAPEYVMKGIFSAKSDVYSYGVLLLEIVTGKRNNSFYYSNNGLTLVTYTWKLWNEGKALEIVDSILEKSWGINEILKCIHIGLLCVQDDASDRPTMSTVVLMLASDTITLPTPKQPAFSIGRMVFENCSMNEATISSVVAR